MGKAASHSPDSLGREHCFGLYLFGRPAFPTDIIKNKKIRLPIIFKDNKDTMVDFGVNE